MHMGVVENGLDLARVRERFLQGATVESGVRSMILNSWQRSRVLGLSPDRTARPYRPDVDPEARLVRAADPVLDWLQGRFAGSRMNIGLADAEGTILARRFGEPSLARRLPEFQVVPGFVFAEHLVGTNGIGIALAERRLCQVYGAEHFAERSQTNACSAIPIRDLVSGRIEGVLSFGCPRTDASPLMDVLISKAATAIERRLLEQSSARERALPDADADVARARAEVDVTGGRVGHGQLAAAGADLDVGLNRTQPHVAGSGDQRGVAAHRRHLDVTAAGLGLQPGEHRAQPDGAGTRVHLDLAGRPVRGHAAGAGVQVEAAGAAGHDDVSRAGP